MPSCNLCDTHFPNRVKIDGKFRNLQRRKFCLSCSPFDQHNTKNLTKPKKWKAWRHRKKDKICKLCKKHSRGNKCSACYQSERRRSVRIKIHSLTGYNCWLCNYGGTLQHIPVLDFHHVDPTTKLFNLNAANITTNSWSKVLNELRKCALLCCRCHREHHAGLINDLKIHHLHKNHWN